MPISAALIRHNLIPKNLMISRLPEEYRSP
jgi:hypothetical protein